MRVFVVQMNDKPHIDLIVFKMIDERSAPGIAAERPAHGMRHPAQMVLFGINLPDFLHAEAEFLRAFPGRKVVFLDDFLGQGPAHPFRQEHIFADQRQTGLMVRPRRAIGQKPELAGHHAAHGAVRAIDHLRTGHAGENLDPQSLGFLRKPAAEIGHRDDVIAVVRHQGRHRPVRDADLAGGAEDVEIVFLHRHLDRRAALTPIGDQRIQPGRVEHRPRQDMRADLRALFQHHDGPCRVQLLQPDRRRQARGTGTDHDHVIVHFLTGDLGHRRIPCCAPRECPRAGRRSIVTRHRRRGSA